ncbi:MAG: protein kinase, partial [Planctomycetota bacterium]
MIDTACPPRESLLRYLQGNFDSSQVDAFEQHLQQCPSCEETVAELEDANDTLMRHLPLAAIDDAEGDAGAPAWIARLRAGVPIEHADDALDDEEARDSAPVAEDWAKGLAAYELLEIIGKGGMGVVYRGRHRQLGRPVAVKVVRPKLVSAAAAQRRFDREIQILGRLNHPGIVAATDAG